MQDGAGEKMRNQITSRTWAAPISGDVARAVAMSQTFDKAHADALEREYPENLTKVFPADALAVLQTYLLDVMNDVDDSFLTKLAAMPVVDGCPISNAVEWQANDGTCAAPKEPENEKKDVLDTGSFKGLLSSISKQVINREIDKKTEEKRREIALAPIFNYVETVQSIKIEDLRSSQLDVNARYKLIGRK